MNRYARPKVSKETSLSIILDVSLSSTSTDVALAEDAKISGTQEGISSRSITQSQDPDTFSFPDDAVQDEMISIWSPDYQGQASIAVSMIKMDESHFGFIDDAPISSSGDEELSEIRPNIEQLVDDKNIVVDCEIVGHNIDMAQIINGGVNAQNGFLGPTFKANKKSGSVWTPSFSRKPTTPTSSSLLSPTFSPSSQINSPVPRSYQALLSPTPFSFGAQSSKTDNFSKDISLPVSTPLPILDLPGDEKAPPTTPLACLPPAPPPPPPHRPASLSSSRNFHPSPSSSKQETPFHQSSIVAVANDPDRSIIEYPEKQSVASLRNKIETKLNGSIPVRGYMTASGQIVRPEPGVREVIVKSATLPEKVNNIIEVESPFSTNNFTIIGEDTVNKKAPNFPQMIKVPDDNQAIDNQDRNDREKVKKFSEVNAEARRKFFESDTPIYREPDLSRQTIKSPTPPRVPPPPTTYETSQTELSKNGQPETYGPPKVQLMKGNIFSSAIEKRPTPIKAASHYCTPCPTVDRSNASPCQDRQQNFFEEKRFNSALSPVSSEADRENQHSWYKKMYGQIHHVDKKRDDEAVLRYQMRDYLDDKYQNKVRTEDRRKINEDKQPVVVTYKISEYSTQPDFGFNPSRRVRSKSASRFENYSSSPPLTDVVRYASPGERYKHQPKRIEDYIPGESSVANYEQEKNRHVIENTRPQSSMAYTSTPSRLFSPIGKKTGYNFDYWPTVTPKTGQKQSPFVTDPVDLLNRYSEARHQYRNVQTGGDVPLTGLNQLTAPDRIDILHLRFIRVIQAVLNLSLRHRQNSVCTLPQISEHSNECSTIVDDIMQSSRSAENLFDNRPVVVTQNIFGYSSSGTGSESLDMTFLTQYGTNSQFSKFHDEQEKTNSSGAAFTKANLGPLENQAPSLNEFEELARIEKELVVESERRKKYERELDDQRSRRHGYIPCQIKTPLIGDNRFEKLISDYSKPSTTSAAATTTRMSPTPVEFRGVARALHAFTAHAPKELSFFKGDLIKVKNIIDENWYEGELNGIVGLVPANHVELLATAGGDERVVVTEVSKTREGQAQVLYNFDGRGLNELPLCKNEYITLTRKVDNNWYEGRNQLGRKGIFPSNYIRVLQEPSSDLKDYVSALSPPYQGYQQPGTEFKIQVNGVQYDRREPDTGYGGSYVSGKVSSSSYGNHIGGPSSSSYEIPVRRPKSPANYQPSYDSAFRSLALSQPSSLFTDPLDKVGSYAPFGSKSGLENNPGGQSSSYEESYERKLPDGSTSYTYKKTDYNTQTTYKRL